VLTAWCTDALGNESAKDIETFRVDTTPPSISKEMFGQYLGDCPPESEKDVCYVADNGTSGVIINATDGGEICAVDNLNCYYEVWWEDNPQAPIDFGEFSESAKVTFKYDSKHRLYVYCEDALGNYMDDWEEFQVDSTPPETTKTYGLPFYQTGGNDYITSSTPITFNVVDPLPHPSGVKDFKYRVTLVDDSVCYRGCTDIVGNGDWNNITMSKKY